MAKKKFTSRLSDALDLVQESEKKYFLPDNRSLYSPVERKGGYYEWVKVMDSDGVLLAERPIKPGEGAQHTQAGKILVGVIIQSEDATSQTKPNPLGKAALPHVENGIWVTIKNVRRRIDHFIVLFVLPEGQEQRRKRPFKTAQRNVRNALELMPGTCEIAIKRGASSEEIMQELCKEVRRVLVGKGRPAG